MPTSLVPASPEVGRRRSSSLPKAAAALVPELGELLDEIVQSHQRRHRHCAVLRFLFPCLGELLGDLCCRCYRSAAIKMSRAFWGRCCGGKQQRLVPLVAAEVTPAWLGRALGAPGLVEAVSLTPLAMDEGFTSALYIAEVRWHASVRYLRGHYGTDAADADAAPGDLNSNEILPPAKVVLKMCPAWSAGEQLTSALQLQHTKEAWVIERWNMMGCRVPRGFYTATRPRSGEFIHVMEYMDGFAAGDQLASLPLALALAAVKEVALLHAKHWGCGEKEGDSLGGGRRAPASAPPLGARLCDRLCFGSDLDERLESIRLLHHQHRDCGPQSRRRRRSRQQQRRRQQLEGGGEDHPPGWDSRFDGLANHRRVLAAFARKQGVRAVTTLQGTLPPFLPAMEEVFMAPPQTIIHGDLRSANVMFPAEAVAQAETMAAAEAGGSSSDSTAGASPGPASPQFSTDSNETGERNRPCLLDWGGLQQGKGVFDVAYLLGTGMSASER